MKRSLDDAAAEALVPSARPRRRAAATYAANAASSHSTAPTPHPVHRNDTGLLPEDWYACRPDLRISRVTMCLCTLHLNQLSPSLSAFADTRIHRRHRPCRVASSVDFQRKAAICTVETCMENRRTPNTLRVSNRSRRPKRAGCGVRVQLDARSYHIQCARASTGHGAMASGNMGASGTTRSVSAGSPWLEVQGKGGSALSSGRCPNEDRAAAAACDMIRVPSIILG